MLKIRKQDDSEYRLLCFIGCGLLRHMQEENVHAMTFLDEQDHCFAVFRKVLNARMKLFWKGLRYLSKTSLSYETGTWGQDLDWWSIRVRLSSSSTVYTFITVRYSVWGLFDKHMNLGFLKLRISFQTVSGCVSSYKYDQFSCDNFNSCF